MKNTLIKLRIVDLQKPFTLYKYKAIALIECNLS